MSNLQYIVREPKIASQNPPLLILLHGYGSNEHDLFSFAEELPEDLLIISVQAPLSIGNGGYAWYSINFDEINGKFSDLKEAKEALDAIAGFIDDIKNKYTPNPEKTFLLGFSQGAILSWALGFYKSNKIRRIMPISGLLHESVITKNKPTFLAYASHGIEDNVIPIEKAREFIVPISNNNSGIHYKEFNDGHTISQENFSELLKWIEKTNL